MRKIVWLGSSIDDLRNFSEEARRETGYQLDRVQKGIDPVNWRPMPGIGAGVREIRIRVEGSWRVIYLATKPEAVYALHAFRKKTQKTPKKEIDLAKARLKEIL